MKTKVKGQSVVELVFSVGIIVLVITGVVALMVNNIGSRNKGFDRKKATEVAQVIIENLIQKKSSDAASFWSLDTTNIYPPDCNPGAAYSCSAVLTQDLTSPKCINPINCINAVVTVGWSGSTDQKVTFTRFFSKTGN